MYSYLEIEKCYLFSIINIILKNKEINLKNRNALIKISNFLTPISYFISYFHV